MMSVPSLLTPSVSLEGELTVTLLKLPPSHFLILLFVFVALCFFDLEVQLLQVDVTNNDLTPVFRQILFSLTTFSQSLSHSLSPVPLQFALLSLSSSSPTDHLRSVICIGIRVLLRQGCFLDPLPRSHLFVCSTGLMPFIIDILLGPRQKGGQVAQAGMRRATVVFICTEENVSLELRREGVKDAGWLLPERVLV